MSRSVPVIDPARAPPCPTRDARPPRRTCASTWARRSSATAGWRAALPAPPSTTPSRRTPTRGCSRRSTAPAAGSTWPARRRCTPRSRPAPCRRPRVLQPGQAPRRHRVRRRARRPPVRRRQPRGDREGRRRRSRRVGALPAGHLGRGLRLAALAQVRLLDPARPSTCCGTPPGWAWTGRRLVPRRVPAARPRGVGRADRRQRAGLPGAARVGDPSSGCWTWAAASRPRLAEGCPPLAAYGAAIERHLARHFGSRRPRTLDRARPRHRGRGRRARRRGARRRPPRRHPLGVPRRGCLHRPGRDPGRGDPLPDRDRPRRRADRPVRAGRTDLRQRRRALRAGRWSTCRSTSPRATGSDSLGTGAYTTCYSTVGFNGFPPLPTRLVRDLPRRGRTPAGVVRRGVGRDLAAVAAAARARRGTGTATGRTVRWSSG